MKTLHLLILSFLLSACAGAPKSPVNPDEPLPQTTTPPAVEAVLDLGIYRILHLIN